MGHRYITRSKNQIFEVKTATGKKSKIVTAESLADIFNGDKPVIHCFLRANDNGILCLAQSGSIIKTLKISGESITPVFRADNPFVIVPHKIVPETQSSYNRAVSKIIFVNDTSERVDIEWIDQSKCRTKYASLEPGQLHIQKTRLGHAFIAGDLAFFAKKEPAIAYLSSKPVPKKEAVNSEKPKKWSARIEQNNLYIKNSKTEKEIQLTTDGVKGWSYRAPFLWSSDGGYLVASKVKEGTRRTIDIIHSAPSDQLQPRTESILYAKPGDILDIAKPHLFNLTSGKDDN